MSMSIGIVGLPNVGKSTLFNVLTRNQVLAANYPFATIEPNVGIVEVPDERLQKLTEISQSVQTVPAACTFVDIAGIVRGASEGAGLGNKFLSHIRECHAIVQVVRAFVNDDIVHVEGKVDPEADIETIRAELCLADMASIQKRLNTLQKELKSNPKAAPTTAQLQKLLDVLDQGQLLSTSTVEIPEEARDLQLLTVKPFIYVFNIDEGDLGNQAKKDALTKIVDGSPAIFLSAETEAQLMDLPAVEAQELLSSLGQAESGLVQLIKTGYQTLGYISFFTSGPKESRAWTVTLGATAPQAAGVIHTDFEKGFIRAEVASYEDFVAGNGWGGAQAAGKVRLEGKDYVVADGDVMVFRHS